jgi:beta propeller repeat protein
MKKGQISAWAKAILMGAMLMSWFMAVTASVAMADPPGWTITQLTNNGYFDYNPQISGSNVVWQGLPFTEKGYEIFFYNGSTTTQLTDNGYDDINPQVSGTNVVWQGSDGSDYEIFFFNGSTGDITQLTNNSYTDEYPQISGSNVVWQGYDGNDYEIFFYNGSTGDITQLTTNSYDDLSPQISGSNVVWTGWDGDWEIFFYNGSTTTQLTINSTYDLNPCISGTNVAWTGTDGNCPGAGSAIFFYNGSTTNVLACQAGGPSFLLNLGISGSNVVWLNEYDQYSDYSDVFFCNGSRIARLNMYYSAAPQISGSHVVWQEAGAIFYYNGSINTQLTDNGSNPQISGSTVSTVVWQGSDGHDDEIFMAKLNCPYTLNGDLNDDCKFDFEDFAIMASGWLADCNDVPSNPACVPK